MVRPAAEDDSSPSPVLDSVLSRRVIVLTGKGGVGKSTTAAALALVAAQRGRRVLLIEVDAKGNLPDYFDADRVGFKPRRLHGRVFGLSMQPHESMEEYLHLYLKLPRVSMLPMKGFIGYASRAIPGLKEILVTGKIYWEERKTNTDGSRLWDTIIVDGAPTGHVVGQLSAARHLAALVRSGPIHDQAEAIAALFADPDTTALALVAIPEEMPVNETIDLVGRFERETDIVPNVLFINQLQSELLPSAGVRELRRLVTGAGRQNFLDRHPEGEPILDAAAKWLASRRRSEDLQEQLREALGLPEVLVPFLYQRRHGLAFTRELARAMLDPRSVHE